MMRDQGAGSIVVVVGNNGRQPGARLAPGSAVNAACLAVVAASGDPHGKDRLTAQKTAAIPAKDGVYLVQINANGSKDTIGPLMDATAAIDKSLTITVP